MSKLGNKRDKNDLDEDKSSVDKFWDRVSEANLIEDKYRELVQQDEWFNYNSKHIILPHTATKLKEMWHELRRNYMRVKGNQNKSGQGSNNFKTILIMAKILMLNKK